MQEILIDVSAIGAETTASGATAMQKSHMVNPAVTTGTTSTQTSTPRRDIAAI